MKQIFESKNISYVEVCFELIDDYLFMINDLENVGRFIGRHDLTTKEQETEWIQKKLEEKAIIFSMVEKRSDDFIGSIELMDLENCCAELGIAITRPKQNMGYGTESIEAIIDYGIKHYNLKKIVLKANKDNARAIHVYKKCGFIEYKCDEDTVYMKQDL